MSFIIKNINSFLNSSIFILSLTGQKSAKKYTVQ
jgi:hypothetical protein